MTNIWFLCVILLGPGPSFVAPIDVTEKIFTPREQESRGKLISQIKYLDAYIHSIANVPQDFESSTGQRNESKAQGGVNVGSPGNIVLNYSAVDQYNRLPVDLVRMLETTSQEKKTGDIDTSKSIHGQIIIPRTASPETNLTMPQNHPIPVPLCNGEECPSKESEFAHPADLHPEDYVDVLITDDLAYMISDILFLTLKKKSSLSVSLKVHRPSPVLENKSCFVCPEPKQFDIDGDYVDQRNDGDDDRDDWDDDWDDQDDGADRDDGDDRNDGDLRDDVDDQDDRGDDQDDRVDEDDQESKTPDMSVLKPGQTGILLDGSHGEGLLLITNNSSNEDSTKSSGSLSQGESSTRKGTNFKKMAFFFVKADKNYEDEDDEEVETGRFENAVVKRQAGNLFYGHLSGSDSLTENSKGAKGSYSQDEDAIRNEGSTTSHVNPSKRKNQFHDGLNKESHRPNSNARRRRPHKYGGPPRRRFVRCYVHRRRNGGKFAGVRRQPQISVIFHNYSPSIKNFN